MDVGMYSAAVIVAVLLTLLAVLWMSHVGYCAEWDDGEVIWAEGPVVYRRCLK